MNTEKNKNNGLTFYFLDAPTGYGKTTAIINKVNSLGTAGAFSSKERVIILTPYLTEISRICSATSCKAPIGKKQQDLQTLIDAGENICCTHSLFNQITADTLRILKECGYSYSLIIDEEPPTFQKIVSTKRRTAKDNPSFIESYGKQDYDLLMESGLLLIDTETRRIYWNENHPYNTKQYGGTGIFDALRERLTTSDLYAVGKTIIQCPKRSLWLAFSSVTICSYRMYHSLLRCYCDLYDIAIKFFHIQQHNFADGYKELKPTQRHRIETYTPPKMTYSCSKYWYNKNINKRSRALSDELCSLRESFRYFRRKLPCTVNKRQYIWTCYKEYLPYVTDTHLAKKCFIPCNMKATNNYNDCCIVGYLIKRFLDVDIQNFIKQNHAKIRPLDLDSFSLSELIQFIWRTNVRNEESTATVYVFIGNKYLHDIFYTWAKE